jgi:adenine-specific DNA-methyltransferase
MKLLPTSPAKTLSKAYLKQSLKRDQIDHFKETLGRLFERICTEEHEEHLKNIVSDFLKDTWYKHTNEINTSGRADLVIHNGTTSATPVGVLIEVKRPSNKNEMITPERPNVKALHELLHYYMQERYIKDNNEIKHLIISNIYEWYVFDAVDFEKFFFHNQKLVKSYKDWQEGLLVGINTDWFYQEIAKPFIEKELDELPCTYFDLKDFERIIRSKAKTEDNKLLSLYKILSPTHLLKQSFTNDSNSLNREFYGELLHIIGLEEVKEKGKKLIQRKPTESRNLGSLLESTCSFLKSRNRINFLSSPQAYGDNPENQLFGVALELCITWLNRLLFLKLLEGQLIAYHKGDRNYSFLNNSLITDYDELSELFFDVLAVKTSERSQEVQAKFGKIPYLNSSLFEETDLERSMMGINVLKNRIDLPIYSSTVLKLTNGKRRTGNINTLSYLFEFLDAYDFGAEGTADIQEQNKSIINASVLGLIFEKINGYKDGSYFTPGFITMYICSETIRRAVVGKFNEAYGWQCKNITDLYNDIYRHKVSLTDSNALVNNLKICDPAVGSGHFLVSALNEIIAVKSELKILASEDGKLLRCDVAIENDELIVTVDDHIFEYNYQDMESQRVQETLFHEKETIVENCLFGVDINAKSAAICRLRLWIEMLKNAYYRRDNNELETLPNIDINIKCGNSLVSRFALTGNTNLKAASKSKLKELTERYRQLVVEYKLSSLNKPQTRKDIEALKHELENFGLPNDKDYIALLKGREELSVQSLFGFNKKEQEARKVLQKKVDKLEKSFEEKQVIYKNAFEWRFEFPEILDAEGDFVGFDAIIGNPPYIRQEAIKDQKPAFKEMFGPFFCSTADIYTYFYKTGLNLLKTAGTLCYIAPNKFMRAGYGKNTRELLITQSKPLLVLDFGDLPVFDEATTYPSIVMVDKNPATLKPSVRKSKKVLPPPVCEGSFFTATLSNVDQLTRFAETLSTTGFTMPIAKLRSEGWSLERSEVLSLMDKIRTVGEPLGNYVDERFYYGIKTSFGAAYIIDSTTRNELITGDPSCDSLIKPWLSGKDIKKWDAKWLGKFIINLVSCSNYEWPWAEEENDLSAEEVFKSTYPTIHAHVKKYEEKLKKRDDQGRFWWELRSCAYYRDFELPKIILGRFMNKATFCYDDKGYFHNDAMYMIAGADKYIVAVLNSDVGWWSLKKSCTDLQNGYVQAYRENLFQIPIVPASDAQKAPIIILVDKILADPSSPQVTKHEADIDSLIYNLYGLTEDEIAIVERE